MKPKKRRIMVKARLTEISAVDKPAQENALAVLRKRDEQGAGMPAGNEPARRQDTSQPAESAPVIDYAATLRAAEHLALGGRGRLFSHITRDDFQAAQVDYVKRHTKPGETEAQATVRLTNDPVVQQLDRAWREAQAARETEQAEEYSKARAEGRALPETRKLTSAGYMSKADIDEQLRKVADETRRSGETNEQAYARAMAAHPELYRAYREASD